MGSRISEEKLRGGGREGEGTYLPDRRLTIFLSERTTPYTSLASSSKARPVPEVAAGVAAGGGGGGGGVPPGGWLLASLSATRTPEVEERVLRGLVKGVPGVEPGAEAGPEEEGGRGETARETAGRRAPPWFARFGRLVRCQSW